MTQEDDSPPTAVPSTDKPPDSDRKMSAEHFDSGALSAEDTKKSIDGDSKNPFEDPLQRTRCLIQFIRLRKQRAERERAKRLALRKQKKDARATLQNARESLRVSEDDVRRCEVRLDELNQTKVQLSASLKSLTNKEAERKRQRDAAASKAAEEARRVEKQRVQAQQQAALAQLMGIDALFQQQQQQQQIKNTQLLNALNAMNKGPASHQLGFSSPNSSIAVSASSPHPGRFSPATPASLSQQQQQQQQSLFAQLAAAGLNAAAGSGGASLADTVTLQQQIQQKQTSTNFLRPYAAGAPQFRGASLGGASDQSAAMLRAVSQTLDALQQQQQQPASGGVNLGAAATPHQLPNLSLLQQQQQQQQANRRMPQSNMLGQPAAILPPSASGTGPTFHTTEALVQLAAAGGGTLSNDLMYQALLANFGLQSGAAK